MTFGSWALWNIGIGALMGAAGVVLAAVAAHRTADPSLATAALFLILHGVGAIALTAIAGGTPWPTVLLGAVSLMLVAVALFSGDVSSRVLLGDKLFPMAAPLGGSLLIGSWLIAAVTALFAAIRG
ncbi:MAG: DUF423 domain-containing protein [Hyphomicrobium sp.]|jgi:uncharacterized membrane protein YgdD (TMEM256/DUF423 family)|uniref:DUF423 domain-containing protein n=1 Tax=Hyphomicrobium sp. TaxID=82 RepID=UPI0025C5CD50|nr:DUF423 domain-containing protein [Hyphomicrobium sp.]MBX9862457.1 DUF423 domain-containing protein [Hyphomicrobium sp.]